MKRLTRIYMNLSWLTLFLALAVMFTYLHNSKAGPSGYDLSIGKIRFIGNKLQGRCSLSIELKNTGTLPLTPRQMRNSKVKIDVNNNLREVSLEDLDKSNSGTIMYPGSSIWLDLGDVPRGSFKTVDLKVNSNFVIPETNENNNELKMAARCPRLPDLSINRIYAKPVLSKKSCGVWVEIASDRWGISSKAIMEQSFINFKIAGQNIRYYLKDLPASDQNKLKLANGRVQVRIPKITIKTSSSCSAEIVVPPVIEDNVLSIFSGSPEQVIKRMVVGEADPSNNKKYSILLCKLPKVKRPASTPKTHHYINPKLGPKNNLKHIPKIAPSK